jgi:hypothetical protein
MTETTIWRCVAATSLALSVFVLVLVLYYRPAPRNDFEPYANDFQPYASQIERAVPGAKEILAQLNEKSDDELILLRYSPAACSLGLVNCHQVPDVVVNKLAEGVHAARQHRERYKLDERSVDAASSSSTTAKVAASIGCLTLILQLIVAWVTLKKKPRQSEVDV